MIRAMRDLNCPKCGYGLGEQLAFVKMLTCPSCGTTLFLRDAAFEIAGDGGVLHELPLLIGLGDSFRIGRREFRTLGHARFSYGRGTWDEFWAMDGRGEGAWISVDEGDVVIQSEVRPGELPGGRLPGLGGNVTWEERSFTVTEVETATCEALRGAFPELLTVGESYRFLNCTGDGGELLSVEDWPGGQSWFLGEWVDPFDIEKTT
jgi:hypothetical protein